MAISNDHARIRAYNLGYEAWERTDISDKDILCPYPIGSNSGTGLRQSWFDGLLDHRLSRWDKIPLNYVPDKKAPPKCRR